VAAALREDGLEADTLVEGSRPAETIVTIARQNDVDVIMLATHGRGGLDRLFMGSVADRVIQNAPCPLFVVPIPEERRPAT
jgi:nucleotide-binding universal stress UspA family protein